VKEMSFKSGVKGPVLIALGVIDGSKNKPINRHKTKTYSSGYDKAVDDGRMISRVGPRQLIGLVTL